MKAPVQSCDEVRKIEQRAIDIGMSSLLMMENAGRSIAELILQSPPEGPCVILCGKGNNGGDGLVIARHLDNAGAQVRVLVFAEEKDLSHDAKIHFNILRQSDVEVHVFPEDKPNRTAIEEKWNEAELIIDAIFGSGLQGALRAPFDQIVTWVNEREANVLAVDVPSGIHGDTGKAEGPAIRAQQTCCMISIKKGLLEPGSRAWTGQLHCYDVGVPRALMADVPLREID